MLRIFDPNGLDENALNVVEQLSSALVDTGKADALRSALQSKQERVQHARVDSTSASLAGLLSRRVQRLDTSTAEQAGTCSRRLATLLEGLALYSYDVYLPAVDSTCLEPEVALIIAQNCCRHGVMPAIRSLMADSIASMLRRRWMHELALAPGVYRADWPAELLLPVACQLANLFRALCSMWPGVSRLQCLCPCACGLGPPCWVTLCGAVSAGQGPVPCTYQLPTRWRKLFRCLHAT